MRAVVAPDPGGPEALRIVDLPDPDVRPGEVLLDVHATALNRADLLQREGRYPPPPGVTEVLGLEAAGVVAAVAPDVPGWSVGQPAMALVAGGGYAERVAVPAGQLMHVPEKIDTVTAAAIPEAFLTGWMALHFLAATRPGDNVLIHAGSSGVGLAAVQIARQLGATPFVTSRTAERLAMPESLGATGIVATDAVFAKKLLDATGGDGADVIIDLVGAAYWKENAAALAIGVRIVMLSLTTGARGEVDFGRLLARQATLFGATLRARTSNFKASLVESFGDWGLPRLAAGDLVPVIDRVLALDEVAAAHTALQEESVVGKILLRTERAPPA